MFDQLCFIPSLDHGVYKSDTMIPSPLKTRLQGSLLHLERFSKRVQKEISTGLKSSIVDPYLYPLIFGLTKYYSSAILGLERCVRLSGVGMSNKSLIPPYMDASLSERFSYKIENAWSTRYQWLPCDISFDEQTGNARCAKSGASSMVQAHSS